MIGVYLQTTHISAANDHSFQNLVSNQSLDIFLLSFYLIDKFSNLNIHTYKLKH